MQTLEALRRRISGTQDLHSIVKTMKAMAAVSIRQFDKAVESLAEFNRTTELGLHVVLSGAATDLFDERQERKGSIGAIVFGSDQGMAGQFNENIVSFTLDGMKALSGEVSALAAAGIRAVPLLQEAGLQVEDNFLLPGSVSGVGRLVQALMLKIDNWRNLRSIDRVYLFYNRPVSGAAYRSHMVRLYPIELEHLKGMEVKEWPSKVLPMYTMERNKLLASLINQHLFVVLSRAVVESQASENSARLAAMQAAERNIEDRLSELNTQYHGQRQNSITSELLDIVSGFEVLSG
jgi:F-type H+-transporting ATPase subunit gamma